MPRLPIAVIQNVANDGPGYFADWAERYDHSLQVVKVWAGEMVPTSIAGYAGLCVLGGPMSVNDELPHLRATEHLIREAIASDVPVLGHCLGGQLMASACGARIRRAPRQEIGWITIDAEAHPTALNWFGAERFEIFQWHGDSFELPVGAQLIASSEHCRHQAFSLGRLHLAMQFHCEITAEKIAAWTSSAEGQAEIAASDSPGVQSVTAIGAQTARLLPQSHRIAEAIYRRWASGLRHA
ncbi:type 1 glutamine amidotransferase [Niveibacterium sp.]|uniref:type 1 glutamine amidotransferase n=1 Tax=Niveibacterium sp. TaxID=2017444 RepID=UPI0035B3F1F1